VGGDEVDVVVVVTISTVELVGANVLVLVLVGGLMGKLLILLVASFNLVLLVLVITYLVCSWWREIEGKEEKDCESL